MIGSGSLFRKLLLSSLALAAVAVFVLDLYLTRYVAGLEASHVQARLAGAALLLRDELAGMQANVLGPWTVAASARTRARITLIAADGRVLADSERDARTMDNHANRPEVRAALGGRQGVSMRYSDTLRRELSYVAVPVPGAAPAAILRLAVPVEEVDQAVQDVRKRMLQVSLIVIGAALALSYILSRRFAGRVQRLQRFAETISAGKAGELLPADALDELGALGRSLNSMSVQLRDSLQRLDVEVSRRETILSGMVEGVLAVDAELRVTFCNRSFASAAGAAYPIAHALPLLSLVRQPELVDILTEVIANGRAVQRRVLLATPDPRAFLVHAIPFGETTRPGALAILHDITDLERLERVRRDFVANVSHEFRTPLAVILGSADTLLDGAIDDAGSNRRFLDSIRTSAIRLNDLAADLLTLSELESGGGQQAEEVLVRSAIDSALRTVATEAAARDVQLSSETAGSDEVVTGDRLRLEQVFINLLTNAVRFNHPGGSVRVRVQRPQPGTVEVAISDTGIGILSQDLPRIFERFYRVGKARSREVGGTGLGLAIVRHAVEAMGGVVRAESELGKGSVFTVVLPCRGPSGQI